MISPLERSIKIIEGFAKNGDLEILSKVFIMAAWLCKDAASVADIDKPAAHTNIKIAPLIRNAFTVGFIRE